MRGALGREDVASHPGTASAGTNHDRGLGELDDLLELFNSVQEREEGVDQAVRVNVLVLVPEESGGSAMPQVVTRA